MSSTPSKRTVTGADLSSRGEPYLWSMGGALALGLIMIFGFLGPCGVERICDVLSQARGGPPSQGRLHGGRRTDPFRNVPASEDRSSTAWRKGPGMLSKRTKVLVAGLSTGRAISICTMRTSCGFRSSKSRSAQHRKRFSLLSVWNGAPSSVFFRPSAVKGENLAAGSFTLDRLEEEHRKAVERRNRVRAIERDEMGALNYELDRVRLALRRIALEKGKDSPEYRAEEKRQDARAAPLQTRYGLLQKEAESIKREDGLYSVVLKDIRGHREDAASFANRSILSGQ